MEAYDPNPWELEAGESKIRVIFNYQPAWGQPGFKKKKNYNNNIFIINQY